MRARGQDTAVDEILEPRHFFGRIEDVLRLYPRFPDPGKEALGVLFRIGIGDELANREAGSFRHHIADAGHLLLRSEAPNRLCGDLDDNRIAAGLANCGDGLPVATAIKTVCALVRSE